VREFLNTREPKHVVELGGWDGSLAAAMLAEFDFIESWVNMDIAPDVPQVCDDHRYDRTVLSNWPWMRDVTADALIASHVFEHMRIHQIEQLLRRWRVDSVFIDSPLTRDPQSWDGYFGSHILEVGSDELVQRLVALGYDGGGWPDPDRLVVGMNHVRVKV
jgi:hypothetical protein